MKSEKEKKEAEKNLRQIEVLAWRLPWIVATLGFVTMVIIGLQVAWNYF